MFTEAEILGRGAGGETVAAIGSIAALETWLEAGHSGNASVRAAFGRATEPRRPWAGLALDRCRLMGVLNVTPDSFSDGGAHLDPNRAVEHGRALLAAGADLLDIGGESTRPGADPVPPEEEIRRVLPVVRALAESGAPISIDTRHAAVMSAALAAGARIVNDVTALSGDPESREVVRRSGASVVLMHMGGEPKTMQENPRYDDVVLDVCDYLESRIAACEAAGIPRERIVVDPGIGFGKDLQHNLRLLAHLTVFHGLGVGLLLGVSRKSFIAKASLGEPPGERLPGSLAAALSAAGQGVQILRVHDVAETRQALRLKEQIAAAG